MAASISATELMPKQCSLSIKVAIIFVSLRSKFVAPTAIEFAIFPKGAYHGNLRPPKRPWIFKTNRKNTMGDKSPKANQKKNAQKQSQASAASNKKQQAAAAKAAANVKKK